MVKDLLDVSSAIRKIEIERLDVTSSKPVNHAAILRKVAERDTPKTIFTDSRE